MSSLTNINNSASVVNVGRTTPVTPGVKPASQSIPVVIASDQGAIPVIEQQKVQSEVALSLLGIPRGEVALGIFSDVNTYDVNPTEWSSTPTEYTEGHGIQHRPAEAGALVEAGKDQIAVLSSKRFFRYQPGRVSAATFGVKSSVSPAPNPDGVTNNEKYDRNPAIRKYGIFDNYDGYYWETRGNGAGDNFAAIRRTQSLNRYNPLPFSVDSTTYTNGTQNKDYRIVGKQADDPTDEPNAEPNAINVIQDQRFYITRDAYNAALAYYAVGSPTANVESYNHLAAYEELCKRDASLALDAYILDLQFGGVGHSVTNATTYRTATLGGGSVAKQNAEERLHILLGETLKTYLSDYTTLNGTARNTRIDNLTIYTRKAVKDIQPALLDLQVDCGFTSGQAAAITNGGTNILTTSSALVWGRNKIISVFAIYKKYLGYLISSSFTGGGANYTEAIKYKCYRDIGYIVDGYARDMAYGGNSATVYNMKNFHFLKNGLSSTLQVYTTFTGYTDPVTGPITFHTDAHTLLKAMISKDGNISNTLVSSGGDRPKSQWTFVTKLQTGWTSVMNLFGLANVTAAGSTKTLRDKFNTDLANPLIANFTTEYQGIMDFGSGSQFGDLITIRDGLIHVHAAVYDPSLLKPIKKVAVNVVPSANTIEVSYGEFVVNQNVTFIGNAGGLANNKIYSVLSVSGPRNNVIKLYDPDVYDIYSTGKVEIDITSVGANNNFIEPVTPFIFPKHYFDGPVPSDTLRNHTKPDGLFPYMYAKPAVTSDIDGNLEDLPFADPDPTAANYDETFLDRVGFINTTYDLTSENAGIKYIRREIDYLNLLYNNWIKQNVDPKYYAVYEYRVPRSRFSGDKLDALERKIVYSDVAFGNIDADTISTVRPGRNVLANGTVSKRTSAWSLDPESVSMLKIEFSWYGAVGAMFLAYVPVGSGEARWVRVHHMRASNQLKVASLGNATLPISYVTYGGGSVDDGTGKNNKLGIKDTITKTYGRISDFIVKYGASYYIDGGDRGTVRLYTHTNNINSNVYGKMFDVGSITTAVNTDFSDTEGYFTLSGAIGPADRTYFMKSQIVTSSVQDQNVFVTWVDGNKIYFNKPSLVSTNGIKIIPDRPAVAFGLKAKENILNSVGFGVRNRVQVYPTKLSTANFASTPVKMDVIKTPLFQPNITTSGSLYLTSSYQVTSDNLPLPVSNANYLEKDEDFVYGWFRSNVGTVFGRLYRDNGGFYYFELKEVFTGQVTLYSGAGFPFKKDGRFDFTGTAIADGVNTESVVEKERLSSVYISNIIQSPVPQSGTTNASFFLKPGSDQFDLLSYFDYNKDYLSYPLTNEISSIYLAASSQTTANGTPAAEISVGLTWEEQ